MNSFKLAKKLKSVSRLRCKYWYTCGAKDCYHYEIHVAREYSCITISPIRYCSKANGFVHDIPANEINFDAECDPNLAFKAQKEADKRVEAATAKHYHKWLESSGMGRKAEEYVEEGDEEDYR